MYTIFIAKNTQRKLKKLSEKILKDLKQEILSLEKFPNIKNIKKLTEKDDIWRLKIKHHRVIFFVEKESKMIKITHIRQRNEKTYKNL